MRHSVLFQHTAFDRTPERPAVPEGYLLNTSRFLIRKLEKPPFRNAKVNRSGIGLILTMVLRITIDRTLS